LFFLAVVIATGVYLIAASDVGHRPSWRFPGWKTGISPRVLGWIWIALGVLMAALLVADAIGD
jgi:hypothetical protein